MPDKRKYPPAQSLNQAIRQLKQLGREKNNLSVERMADHLGESPDLLQKWCGTARLPINKVIGLESLCGHPFITEYLAHAQGYLLVRVPTGRKAEISDLNQLNVFTHQVLASIAECYAGASEPDETACQILQLMQEMAYQHHNVKKLEQPELSFGE